MPVKRIVFHEITEEGDRAGGEDAHDVDDNLVRAQESRRILDRLYGYTLSPVLWKKVQTGLSAGRVQSVAVRLIVDREEERLAFRAARYWDLEAQLSRRGPDVHRDAGAPRRRARRERQGLRRATASLTGKNVAAAVRGRRAARWPRRSTAICRGR